jgi:hypothetical protein
MTEGRRQQPRVLSYSEIETAMTCFAKWDFSYGGRLAGSTLKQKGVVPLLADGSAWGAAVAAWHANHGTPLAGWHDFEALRSSLDADEARMREMGFPVSVIGRAEQEYELGLMLEHYMATAEPMPGMTRLEGETVVGVPSRGGKRASTRYRFLAKIDGAVKIDDAWWIVEFKLRGRLTDLPLLLRQRQPRWYAWAATAAHDRGLAGAIRPAGVIVEERLKAIPKDAALTEKGMKPSHKKEQVTTPEKYVDLCLTMGVEPKNDVIEHLGQRPWQQRVPLSFRPDEIDAAGDELRDAAKLVRDLDRGEITPIRNAHRRNCDGCRYKAVCAEPGDTAFVESLFERTVPKRLREPMKEAA